MIKGSYCSKDLCLKLRDAGIEASSIMKFEKGGRWYSRYTHAVVMRWLREVKHIFVEVCVSIDANGKYHYRYWVLNRECNYIVKASTEYDTYEDAAEAGIAFVLDNVKLQN